MQWGWGWGGCLFVTTGAGHKGYGVELLERGGRGSEKSQKLRYGTHWRLWRESRNFKIFTEPSYPENAPLSLIVGIVVTLQSNLD